MWCKGKTLEDVVVIGEEGGGLYKLKGHLETTLVHETTRSSQIWHERLAHINYKALPYVSKVVIGLPDMNIDHEETCKGCVRGNNIKNPFPKSVTKTKGTLELIHYDVCGPIPSTYLRRYEYYITFIDDYSRNTWIYFLNTKTEVFGKFKEFKALIDRIKTLRSNSGGEYTSKEFEAFCKEYGIKRELAIVSL